MVGVWASIFPSEQTVDNVESLEMVGDGRAMSIVAGIEDALLQLVLVCFFVEVFGAVL